MLLYMFRQRTTLVPKQAPAKHTAFLGKKRTGLVSTRSIFSIIFHHFSPMFSISIFNHLPPIVPPKATGLPRLRHQHPLCALEALRLDADQGDRGVDALGCRGGWGVQMDQGWGGTEAPHIPKSAMIPQKMVTNPSNPKTHGPSWLSFKSQTSSPRQASCLIPWSFVRPPPRRRTRSTQRSWGNWQALFNADGLVEHQQQG